MSDATADYGFDAPHVPVFLAIAAGLTLLLGIAELATGSALGWWWLLVAAVLGGQSAMYVRTTRTGKFAAWERILDDLDLQGDERVLDIGCGRGAVLIAVAKRVPRGEITGVDIWRSVDQSGNAVEETVANAKAEGVADRIELHTADMTKLPYPDACFDLVVSSLAIHNVRARAKRLAAIDQAARVLRPGGRLVIADIQATKLYVKRLQELGLAEVEHTHLGPDFWFGGPWVSASLVTATKTG